MNRIVIVNILDFFVFYYFICMTKHETTLFVFSIF